MVDVNVTVVGYVGSDPILKKTASGLAWTQFRVGSTRRWKDADSGRWQDGGTMWFNVKAWDSRAENIAESVRKGTPVIVTGRLGENPYVITKTGENGDEVTEYRHGLTIENAVVAVDLSRGTAQYVRVDRNAEEPSDIPAYLRARNAPERANPGEMPESVDSITNDVTAELHVESNVAFG